MGLQCKIYIVGAAGIAYTRSFLIAHKNTADLIRSQLQRNPEALLCPRRK